MIELLLGALLWTTPTEIPQAAEKRQALTLPRGAEACQSLETARELRAVGSVEKLSPFLKGVCFEISADTEVEVVGSEDEIVALEIVGRKRFGEASRIWVPRSVEFDASE